jgi:hypothetical protein
MARGPPLATPALHTEQKLQPEAQFPSAVPLVDVQESVETQVPNITKLVLAEVKVVHCLKNNIRDEKYCL